MLVRLSLELFLSEDRETAQYRIQSAFRTHWQALREHRLFPTWQQAQTLHTTLQQLLQERQAIEEALPHTVVGIDWKSLRLERRPAYSSAAREGFLQQVFALAEWALPELEKLCRESHALYDFATEHIALHEVGLCLPHRSQGFLLIPYRAQQQLLIWHYQLQTLFDASQRHPVQLQAVASLPLSPIWTPQLWQSFLRERFPHIRGALYLCDSDEDFPLRETLLPIAEEQLALRVGM